MRRADRLFRIVQRLRRRGVTTARSLAEDLHELETVSCPGASTLEQAGQCRFAAAVITTVFSLGKNLIRGRERFL